MCVLDWSIVFFIDAQGHSRVEEFLDSLDPRTQRRFGWSMEQLRLRNIQARPPLVGHLDGKLWELREESATNIYRLIYFFFGGRRIVFVHGFQKKTQRTPPKVLETARRRHQAFLATEGGEQS
jgi:phage-related protein